MTGATASQVCVSIASESDRHEIYAIRHRVYAQELQQHQTNSSGRLRDNLDAVNHYIVAKRDERIVGFVSITPPASPTYSVDKYFSRSLIPYPFDGSLFEVRLLTVIEPTRNSFLALALMFAAFRWVQSHSGKHIVSICRSEILGMYQKAGLRPLHHRAVSGKVSYELCIAEVEDLHALVQQNLQRYRELQSKIEWQLPFAYFTPSACYHGGAFFEAIGEDLQDLHRAAGIINADVLDAWFPPSPAVLGLLQQNLPWLLQTSPPTHAAGLVRVIAEKRGVKEHCILPGAGSSDLIFLAFRTLLRESSNVLILDPCYGEYIHVLENVVQCRVTRVTLRRENNFAVDTSALLAEIQTGFDMVVLVNPNSPTGGFIPKAEMEAMLPLIPASTLVWIDETYIEYAGADESLEQFATATENVIICKSMSKVYALSGVRAAYLCCSPHLIESLQTLTPPWAVSLPAQAAAIAALNDSAYYREKYAETHILRRQLHRDLHHIGITEIIEGAANFLLFFLPPEIPVNRFLELCREENVYLRNVSNMGRSLGNNAIRIAVKDELTNRKMIAVIRGVLGKLSGEQ